MSGTIRVFVNGRGLDVDAGADVGAALRAADPALAERIAAGGGLVTDGRGIDLPLDAPLAAGAILRAAVSARRVTESTDADA